MERIPVWANGWGGAKSDAVGEGQRRQESGNRPVVGRGEGGKPVWRGGFVVDLAGCIEGMSSLFLSEARLRAEANFHTQTIPLTLHLHYTYFVGGFNLTFLLESPNTITYLL